MSNTETVGLIQNLFDRVRRYVDGFSDRRRITHVDVRTVTAQAIGSEDISGPHAVMRGIPMSPGDDAIFVRVGDQLICLGAIKQGGDEPGPLIAGERGVGEPELHYNPNIGYITGAGDLDEHYLLGLHPQWGLRRYRIRRVNEAALDYGPATYTIQPGHADSAGLMLGIHPQFGLRRFRIAEQATRETWGHFLVTDATGSTTSTGFVSANTLSFGLPPGTWMVKILGTLLGDNLSSNQVEVRVNIGGMTGTAQSYPGGAIRPFAASYVVANRSGSQMVSMEYQSPIGGTTRRFGWHATIIAERTG